MRRDGRWCSPWWSTLARLGGSRVDGGDASVVSGEDGLHDEIQHDVANSMVCITQDLISCNSEGGGWS
jgi:hypothetical protein